MSTRTMLVLLVFVLFVSEAFAAQYVDLTQTHTVVRRDLSKIDERSLWDSIRIIGQTALKFKDVLVTAQGNKVKKFQETFRGIPVYDTLVDIEDIQDGGSHVLVGDVYDGLEDDLEWQMNCTLWDGEAVQIALDYANMSDATVINNQTSEVIYIADNQTAFYTLQLHTSVSMKGGGVSRNHTRLLTFISICDGEVLQQDQMMGQVAFSRRDSDTTDWITTTTDSDYYDHSYYDSGSTSSTSPASSAATDDDYYTTGYGGTTDDLYYYPTQDSSSGTTTGSANTASTGGGDYVTDAATDAATDDDGGGGDGSDATKQPPIKAKPTVECGIKQKAGNPKRMFYFGTKPHCLELKRIGDTCYLENDLFRGVDLKETEEEDKTEIVRFPCAEGYKDATNGGFAPMFEIFYFATETIKVYTDWYGHIPIKTPTYVKAHYGKDNDNAYFDGDSMAFGDGDGKETYPWTNLDTVAHEYGHGVVDQSSGLRYKHQPGGLNEAYADMIGEVVEEYVFGKFDMLVGADMYIAPNTALRWFDDPTRDGHSIKHMDDYNDDVDVHYSSGVYNHVFHHMVKAFETSRVAFEPFVNANRMFWKPNTDFENAACGVIQGAYEAGLDMGLVVNCFKQVGITLKQCKPLHQYVTAQLKPGEIQTGLHISKARHPLFKVNVKGVTKNTIIATTSSGYNVAISRSHTRSPGDVIADGPTEVKAIIPRNVESLYIRVFSELGDQEIRSGSVSFVFE